MKVLAPIVTVIFHSVNGFLGDISVIMWYNV